MQKASVCPSALSNTVQSSFLGIRHTEETKTALEESVKKTHKNNNNTNNKNNEHWLSIHYVTDPMLDKSAHLGLTAPQKARYYYYPKFENVESEG